MNSAENEELTLYDMYLVLKKRYKLIAGILAVSLFLTGIISYFERPVYRSNFIIKIPSFVDSVNALEKTTERTTEKIPVISSFEIKKIIGKLNSIVLNEKNPGMLSEKLGMGKENTRILSSLTVTFKGKSDEFVEISIAVYDAQPVSSFKSAILQILTEHIAIKTTFLRKKNLLEKEEIDVNMKKMDEIRDIVFTGIKKEGAKYIGFNPLELERDLLYLKKRLIDIENENRSLSDLEIVAESMMPQKMRPRISLNFAVAVIASLIVGIFLSFMFELLEKNVKKVRHDSGKENI